MDLGWKLLIPLSLGWLLLIAAIRVADDDGQSYAPAIAIAVGVLAAAIVLATAVSVGQRRRELAGSEVFD